MMTVAGSQTKKTRCLPNASAPVAWNQVRPDIRGSRFHVRNFFSLLPFIIFYFLVWQVHFGRRCCLVIAQRFADHHRFGLYRSCARLHRDAYQKTNLFFASLIRERHVPRKTGNNTTTTTTMPIVLLHCPSLHHRTIMQGAAPSPHSSLLETLIRAEYR